MKSPTIYLVAEEEIARCSLSSQLLAQGFCSVSYPSANDFLAQAEFEAAGVVIADMKMPERAAEELMQRLQERASDLAVIVVTRATDVKTVVSLMQKGAFTVLGKPVADAELQEALNAAAARSSKLAEERSQLKSLAQKLAALSGDDRVVLERMIAGKSIKSCSLELNLSTRTIERKRKAILDKMGIDSIPALAVMVEKVRGRKLWPSTATGGKF